MTHEIRIRHQRRKNLRVQANQAGIIEVYVPLWLPKDSPVVQQCIDDALRQLEGRIPQKPPQITSTDELRQLVDEWAEIMQLYPKRVTFRFMQSRWGSCSWRGNITLNTALTWVPLPLAEYVIVHELAHLRFEGHGEAFQEMLDYFLPDWRTREAALRTYEL